MEYFLSVLGMVFIIEALPYMAFPGKVKELARFIENIPNRSLQIMGVFLALSGVAIIYLARRVIGA